MDRETPQGEGVFTDPEESHELAEEATKVRGVRHVVPVVYTVIYIQKDLW